MALVLRSLLARGTCLLSLGLAASARAEAADPAAAEALFQRARDAMAAEDYTTACSAFEESNRLDPAPGTMVNLASCEEKRGRLATAWQWLEQAVTKLPAGDSRHGLLEERARDMKARLPLLTIRLAPGTPPGTTVTRDSVELHAVSLGLALPIDPGAHHIVASAPGHAASEYAVTLREKEQQEVVVEPGPAGETRAAFPGPESAPRSTGLAAPADSGSHMADAGAAPRSGSDTRTLGYVVGGIGVAGIGTALVLGGLVLGKKSVVAEHCASSDRTCDQTGLDAASSGKTLSTVSTVSFIVGAVATGLGAYFIVTSKDAPKTAVGAAALPGGGELHVVKEF